MGYLITPISVEAALSVVGVSKGIALFVCLEKMSSKVEERPKFGLALLHSYEEELCK